MATRERGQQERWQDPFKQEVRVDGEDESGGNATAEGGDVVRENALVPGLPQPFSRSQVTSGLSEVPVNHLPGARHCLCMGNCHKIFFSLKFCPLPVF